MKFQKKLNWTVPVSTYHLYIHCTETTGTITESELLWWLEKADQGQNIANGAFKDNHKIFQMIVIVKSWKKPLSHDRGWRFNVSTFQSCYPPPRTSSPLQPLSQWSPSSPSGSLLQTFITRSRFWRISSAAKLVSTFFFGAGTEIACLSIMILLAKIWPTARTFTNYDDADSFSQSLPQAGKMDPGVNRKLGCLENQF